MTLKEASQIYYAKKEIRKIRTELYELEAGRTFSKAITYSDMPKGTGSDGNEADDYLDRERQLTDMLRYNLQRLQQARLEFEQFLEMVDDAQMRLILRLRCVNNMSWRQIGMEVNTDRTTASKKFYNFWREIS